jgi:hypothetical protein
MFEGQMRQLYNADYWRNWEPANRQRMLEEIDRFIGQHIGAR